MVLMAELVVQRYPTGACTLRNPGRRAEGGAGGHGQRGRQLPPVAAPSPLACVGVRTCKS
jgi:hypothetical protein